jgi:hypothetical protein
MAHDLEAARDVLEDLGHILPNLAQPIAAAGATCGRHRLVCLRRAGQMLGQLPTTLLLASFSRFRIGSWLRRRSGLALTPLQSATAAIVAPGESASSRILSFLRCPCSRISSSGGSRVSPRRRPTCDSTSMRLRPCDAYPVTSAYRIRACACSIIRHAPYATTRGRRDQEAPAHGAPNGGCVGSTGPAARR